MPRTSNFSKNHPYAVARGWVGPGFAAAALDSVSDGNTEVDNVRALLVSGGQVTDLDNGLAQITIGGLSASSNSPNGGGGSASSANVVYMRNTSAFDLIPGDVVVTDPNSDSAITTTATASNTRIAGVVQAPIAKLQYGPVLMAGSGGLSTVINTTGTIARGNYALTSATARLAGATAARVAGSFGVYLTGTDAPDFVTSSASTESPPVTTLSLNMPSPIPAGRVLFAALWLGSAASNPTITGWTRIGAESGYYYFYKVSAGDDTADASWTTATVATATVLLLSPNVSIASPIQTHDYDSSTSAAAVSGLSDAPRYAIAGVAANVASPGAGFTRLGGGTSTFTGSGGTPTLVQSAVNSGGATTATFSSTLTGGNLMLSLPFTTGHDSGTWSTDPREGGTCPQDSALTNFGKASTAFYGSSSTNVVSVLGKTVGGDTYSGPFGTPSGCDSSETKLLLMEFSNINLNGGYEVLYQEGIRPATTFNLGTFSGVGANDLLIMCLVKKRDGYGGSPDPAVVPGGFTEILDGYFITNGWAWAGYKVGNGVASVDYTDDGFGGWGAIAVLIRNGGSSAAGTLAGKYIGHASTATSPFTGAAQQNDAIFAVNLQVDAKPSVLLYGPDLGGGSALAVGSNSTDVAGITAMGATGAYADAAHWHKGVVALTASSSNTLQRPTVNLRPGTNVSFALSDTDGTSEFDTLTISASVTGGGGSPPNNYESFLSANRAIINATTWYSSASLAVTPAAGDYEVLAVLSFDSASASATLHQAGIATGGSLDGNGAFSGGTVVSSSSGNYNPASNAGGGTQCIARARVTVDGSTAIRALGASVRGSSDSRILTTDLLGMLANKASSISATKVTAA